jgi:alkanesulfonate monooxygenase SsuD/methylene tetrahydromethanopterin reductase-like flavin-dependent oxidoreductase (luciferase family)
VKFALFLEMGRTDPDQPMPEVFEQTLDLLRLAEVGGFDAAYTGEHHAIEMTIAPNPFIQLARWAAETKRIRLGTAVVSAPYWNPIRLAGESALLDLQSGGRLELGIGRGAYQYEFDRLRAGVTQEKGRDYLRELVPAVKALWAGDYEHHGECWSFPRATSVPKPLQRPHPPIWISARHPANFELAVREHCNIMATPLHWPFEEVVSLRERLDAAVATVSGGFVPELMVLRSTFVYEDPADWPIPVEGVREHARRFETLFRDVGGVRNGFVELADLNTLDGKEDYVPRAVHENHVFGTPDEVIAKLRRYEDAGVDYFLYGIIPGLPHDATHRSLERFIDHVLPAFSPQPVTPTQVSVGRE